MPRIPDQPFDPGRRSLRQPLRFGVVALALSLAGCGGIDPSSVVEDTAENVVEVTGGVITMNLVAGPAASGPSDREVGFELAGPFSFHPIGPLPVVDLRYTRFRGGGRTATGFVSTGHRAYVERNGQIEEVPAAELAGIVLDPLEEEGLRRFGLDRWLTDARVSTGPAVAGVMTYRIQGRVDAGGALADLLALAGDLGVLDEDGPGAVGDGRALEGGVTSARVQVLTGRTDRVMRRLTLEVGYGEDGPAPLLDVLGVKERPARLTIDLRIDDPNKNITVATPPGAPPFGRRPG